jgi:hypothetical protein
MTLFASKQHTLLPIAFRLTSIDATVTNVASIQIVSSYLLSSNRTYYNGRPMNHYDDSPEKKQRRLELFQHQQLLQERARGLTLSFFRLVLRSIRTIRYGNEHDEIEFQIREEKQRQKEEELFTNIIKIDKRLDMISMAPDVDRVDELLSRANYYTDYARENIQQESDRLPNNILWNNPEAINRYISLLKRGEQHRKWLLKDMKFPILEGKTSTQVMHDQFQQDALKHVKKVLKFEQMD